MNKLAIITVPFIKSDEHHNLARASYESFHYDGEVIRIAVINSIRDDKDLELVTKHNDTIMYNDINCLGRAWNIGVKSAIEQGCNLFYIPNLDVVLTETTISELVAYATKNPQCGVVSSTSVQVFEFASKDAIYESTPIVNHDQSYSSFLITKECYEKVGDFYEFKPAYFEDCDHLYRCQLAGYTPTRIRQSKFYHYGSGSVRHDPESRGVPNYQENKQLYIDMWGGIPSQEIYKTRYNK